MWDKPIFATGTYQSRAVNTIPTKLLFPPDKEGDLIKGAHNRSAVSTLMELTSMFTNMTRMKNASAEAALRGFGHPLDHIEPATPAETGLGSFRLDTNWSIFADAPFRTCFPTSMASFTSPESAPYARAFSV
jgi:hypothetical protein